MSSRIDELRHTGRAVSLPSGFVPWRPGEFQKRKKGAAIAKGLAYEKKVGNWLRKRLAGTGLRVIDHLWVLDGKRWCQPDFLIEGVGGGLVVVEVKYKQRDCWDQIERYKRVLGAQTGIQICRVLEGHPTFIELEDMIDGGVMGLWL